MDFLINYTESFFAIIGVLTCLFKFRAFMLYAEKTIYKNKTLDEIENDDIIKTNEKDL